MAKEDVVKHLEFIQGIINRMANNSFLLKGWSVTLVAALFALAAQNAKLGFVVLAFFPVIVFWILDSYYLRQERLYRELYDATRIKEQQKMCPEEAFYMGTKVYERYVQSWLRTMFSKTLFLFYLGLIITIVIAIIAIKYIH